MSIGVKIGRNIVGYLEWNKGNYASFAYENSFIKNGLEISPIHLPLSQQTYYFKNLSNNTFKGLPGVFSDSLPDKFGEGLMNSYFMRQAKGLADLTPLDRLAYIGQRGMGALEYFPATNLPKHSSDSLSVDQLEMLAHYGIEHANQLNTHLEEGRAEGLQDILSIGTSAGGARPKAIIAYNQQTGEIRSGQLDQGLDFDHWIIKLDVGKNQQLGDPLGFGRIEYTYHQMATDSGVAMSECRLFEENGRGHFMTKRFDRKREKKLHTHTLHGLLHLNYENVDENAYKSLFGAARALKLGYPEKEQLFKRMVFNVLSSNCDDHTKNFSFLMNSKGIWNISPAYDICYSYDPANIWVNGNMRVNGKRVGITTNDILQEAKMQGIGNATAIIDQSLQSISQWSKLAKKNKISKPFIEQIQLSINQKYKTLTSGKTSFIKPSIDTDNSFQM